ncbi:hypothetical protein C8D97_107238 [Pleionea mediterranea]|uniref:Uncharacterized protein n=1 Tax=Pleionea mediterranea TaxID=523701 RepID=A0A316FMF1_9GAMM|nr:hypothetical protein C8D97_107238 [Pleionea mediterranea]
MTLTLYRNHNACERHKSLIVLMTQAMLLAQEVLMTQMALKILMTLKTLMMALKTPLVLVTNTIIKNIAKNSTPTE